MKSLYILVSYLTIFAANANIKTLSNEFLSNNNTLQSNVRKIEISKQQYYLLEAGYSWNLSAGTAFKDGKLEASSTSSQYPLTSNSHSLIFSKGFAWGGSFAFENTLDSYSKSLDTSGFSQKLSYTQDLGANFLGRQSKRALEIAQDQIEVTSQSEKNSRNQLLYTFAASYIQGSLLKSLLDYQTEAYQRALKRRNLIRQKVKDGLREKVDLLQSDSTLLQQEEEVISAENSLKDILQELSEKLHRSVDKKEVDYLKFTNTDLPKGELSSNLNLELLRHQKAVVEKELKSKSNALLPEISLSTYYKTNNYDPSSSPIGDGLLGGDNSELSLALNLSWAIGNEPQKTELAVKRIEELNLAKEIEASEKNLKILDKTIVEKIKNLKQIIKTSQKRIELSQKALGEYNSLYNRGRVDLDTVIRAEETLISTQKSYVSHVSSYRVLLYSLSLLYGNLENYILR